MSSIRLDQINKIDLPHHHACRGLQFAIHLKKRSSFRRWRALEMTNWSVFDSSRGWPLPGGQWSPRPREGPAGLPSPHACHSSWDTPSSGPAWNLQIKYKKGSYLLWGVGALTPQPHAPPMLTSTEGPPLFHLISLADWSTGLFKHLVFCTSTTTWLWCPFC
jgi:hypothetical protein